jgi:hypothetical protein
MASMVMGFPMNAATTNADETVMLVQVAGANVTCCALAASRITVVPFGSVTPTRKRSKLGASLHELSTVTVTVAFRAEIGESRATVKDLPLAVNARMVKGREANW